jgi:hypothetical protein
MLAWVFLKAIATKAPGRLSNGASIVTDHERASRKQEPPDELRPQFEPASRRGA